jgi:hypothetical protein
MKVESKGMQGASDSIQVARKVMQAKTEEMDRTTKGWKE